MTLAFLFPGQGSQAVGMGRALIEARPEARAVFETADRVLGIGLTRLCLEGPAEELTRTQNAQPALLAHSVAALRVLQAELPGLEPSWTAGHSLGEYSACVAAGALGFEDALRLVRRRGELMARAGERPGTMAALLGVDLAAARRLCDEVRSAGVAVPANLNAPGQIVISGDRAAIEAAAAVAPAVGARRYVPLEVSGAFHSPLMRPARDELARELERAPIREPRCPVIANVSAEPVRTAAGIRAALQDQLTSPVRWEDSMRTLLALGASGFVEIGTGRVLRGLLRSIEKSAPAWSVEDPEGVAALRAALGEPGRPLAPEGAR